MNNYEKSVLEVEINDIIKKINTEKAKAEIIQKLENLKNIIKEFEKNKIDIL